MNGFIRQIAALSVLWSMCEMLLPDGRHQHMVRMTASLLVMTSLVTTVGGWLSDSNAAQPAMTVLVQQTAEDTYRRTALTALANQIDNWCVRTAKRAGYQASAKVYITMDGALDHIELSLEQPQVPLMTAQRLAALMAQQLGVSEQAIRLSVEGS